ncbi:RING-H2 finger protein ATL48 [Physcomitrium patens]|uniref:HIG1 domain-containing protein n=1 Tax=Physcomitrium patens TaxID=3218 RepID=A0A2K1JI65_PHYPA|nr:RING-H2 finger protein ATL48-like [Physcomitrium patens]PNR41209.1 hypothetical protein PHYPA_018612 [Physcomitrium patens]|eukprot:XP_024393735.1 RING-H2 finger protein ATL48-like [Physcomitrella patens]
MKDSEILKDGADYTVDMDDMFANPSKKRNPLVLCGALATAGVLVGGLVSFRQGNRNMSQMLMRARVGFQAATVALMAGTVYVQGRAP